MTLITAVCTADWVALAADRRIGTGVWHADVETKVALVDDEYFVAYTGSVPVVDDRHGFEWWLQHKLQGLTAGSMHDYLVNRLSQDAYLSSRRFMLITVGFARHSFSPAPYADLAVVGNSMKSDGQFAPRADIHQFRVWRPLEAVVEGELLVFTGGVYVPDQEVDLHLKERLVKCKELNQETFQILDSAMSEFYGAISEQNPTEVGADVLIATLPRAGIGRHGIWTLDIGYGDPQALAQSVFVRRGHGPTSEYMPALLSSRRPGRSGHDMTQMRFRPGATEFIGPVVPSTTDGPGEY